MSDDKSQTVFTVEREAKERAKKKLNHGELSERLRQTIHEIAYGTEVTERNRLKEKRSDLREEIRDIEREIDDLKHDREKKEREVSRIDDRLDALADGEGEFEGYLQALENDLHEGMRLSVQHGKVERASELGECEASDVIEALKERNPNVPKEAFRDAKPHEDNRWKRSPNSRT